MPWAWSYILTHLPCQMVLLPWEKLSDSANICDIPAKLTPLWSPIHLILNEPNRTSLSLVLWKMCYLAMLFILRLIWTTNIAGALEEMKKMIRKKLAAAITVLERWSLVYLMASMIENISVHVLWSYRPYSLFGVFFFFFGTKPLAVVHLTQCSLKTKCNGSCTTVVKSFR